MKEDVYEMAMSLETVCRMSNKTLGSYDALNASTGEQSTRADIASTARICNSGPLLLYCSIFHYSFTCYSLSRH